MATPQHMRSSSHNQTLFVISLLASVAVFLLVGAFMGFMVGHQDGKDGGVEKGYKKATADLPLCEEDEFLYPMDKGIWQYEGPGKAEPLDYGCVHVDQIRP